MIELELRQSVPGFVQETCKINQSDPDSYTNYAEPLAVLERRSDTW